MDTINIISHWIAHFSRPS